LKSIDTYAYLNINMFIQYMVKTFGLKRSVTLVNMQVQRE